MPKLYLIRHGETVSNASGTFQGQTNSPLSELGIIQAQRLAGRLKKEHINVDRLISSTLGRAIETAEYIAQAIECKLETEPGLQEIDLGNWEGLRWDQISDNFPKHSNEYHQKWWTFKDHEGESWHEALERFNSTIMRLVDNSPEKNLMLVTHGGVIRVFVAKLMGSNSPKPPLEITNTGITEIEITRDQMKMLRINDHNHVQQKPLST
ncbi:MAG: histidine phosphatase family protein [bacterium]|nr:histidine phosphatase family protein [bacterium]